MTSSLGEGCREADTPPRLYQPQTGENSGMTGQANMSDMEMRDNREATEDRLSNYSCQASELGDMTRRKRNKYNNRVIGKEYERMRVGRKEGEEGNTVYKWFCLGYTNGCRGAGTTRSLPDVGMRERKVEST